MFTSWTGARGVVKWAYYNAAAIEGYTLRPHDDRTRWTLTARVVLSDGFKLAQRPLFFETKVGAAVCRWPITSFAVQDGRMTAELGRMEGQEVWSRGLSGLIRAR